MMMMMVMMMMMFETRCYRRSASPKKKPIGGSIIHGQPTPNGRMSASKQASRHSQKGKFACAQKKNKKTIKPCLRVLFVNVL
jgi:hypothetical protein